MPNLALLVVSGATVLVIASWLVPTMIVAGLAVIGRSFALDIVVLLLLGLPVISGVFTPASRVLDWYTTRIANGLLPWTLGAVDRRAFRGVMEARRVSPRVLAAMSQLDNPSRTAAAFRAYGARVSNADAPDPAWADVMRRMAESDVLYAEMLEGTRPLDHAVATEARQLGNRSLLDHLRARSWSYRLLTASRARRSAD